MKLESFVEVIESLVDLYDEETAFAVYDRKEILAHSHSSKMDFNHKVGNPMPKGGTAEESLRTGKRVIRRVPREVLGLPYVGIANPIREQNGEIVGVIVTAVSVEKYDNMVETGQTILGAVQEIVASAENLSASAEQFAATLKNMNTETSRVTADVEHTNFIAEEISKVSAQSNILGINASIEAFRAGEHGRGFAVVANEVRKLAEGTKSSTKEINAILNEVQTSVSTLVESLDQLAQLGESQAAATLQLGSAISAISQMAESLLKMAGRYG